MKGTEDIGGGLKANFKLESGFALDTGVGNTGLFERIATVGLSGGFGDVNLGRQYTAYDSLRGATNNVYDSNMATTSGTKGVWRTGIADYSNRISNSVRYDSPVFGGVSGAVAFGLGENKTATLDAERNISLHVKYVAGPLLVGYAYQEQEAQNGVAYSVDSKGVITAYVAPTATETTKYNLLGASYDLGVAKLTGSYNVAKNNTRKDKEYQLGVSVPFGAAALAAGYSDSESEGTGLIDLSGKGYTLVGTYDLSKRTTLYAGYKSIKVETGTIALGLTTTKDTTFAAGVRHTF
jgi:predicted porin